MKREDISWIHECVVCFHGGGNGDVAWTAKLQGDGRNPERVVAEWREKERESEKGKRLQGHQLLGSASQSVFRLTFSKL